MFFIHIRGSFSACLNYSATTIYNGFNRRGKCKELASFWNSLQISLLATLYTKATITHYKTEGQLHQPVSTDWAKFFPVCPWFLRRLGESAGAKSSGQMVFNHITHLCHNRIYSMLEREEIILKEETEQSVLKAGLHLGLDSGLWTICPVSMETTYQLENQTPGWKSPRART